MTSNPMIQCVGVYKSFQSHEVLRGVDLEIPRGKLTVILGVSGGGKSVLLRHMIGLTRPDRGKIIVEGVDIGKLSDRDLNEFRKKFGMLFQSAALFDSMTVEENIAFPLKEHKQFSESVLLKKVKEKLELVGLEEALHKMPSELSGGMKKRVGLARAIALEPQIILYDEPTTGLDPLMTESINSLIVKTQKTLSMTSVIISHDIKSTFDIADFVAMLHDGKIIAHGSPEEFRRNNHPMVRKFIGVGVS